MKECLGKRATTLSRKTNKYNYCLLPVGQILVTACAIGGCSHVVCLNLADTDVRDDHDQISRVAHTTDFDKS
jgi:hypothetical protein